MTEPAQVTVETADTVNVDQPRDAIPHARFVMAVTIFILIAFVAISGFVLVNTSDETIQGAIIGTWTTMATSAGAFWLGASSGGKLGRR